MTFQERYYQTEANEAVKSALLSGKNPIINLATGTGKSVCQMAIAEWVINTFPGTRVMCLTHESTLIKQNHSKMPLKYNAGIYSAGIGKRDIHNRVIFAGIQSIYKKANLFAPVGIVIIDEVQLLSPEEDTMYQTFISGLREHNPDMLCYGLSATPFRTKHGMITDCTFFDEVVYSYSIADGINDGYLAHLTSKRGAVEVDRSQIKMTGNEFNKKHMAKAFDKTDITAQAVAEIKAYGATRNSWMIFCTDIDHCNHVSDYMQDVSHAVITSKHPKEHNEWAIEAHKSGQIKCLINVNKATVGYDNPMVDLIVLLRSMGSPGLFCQILGRGTRPVYASGFDLNTREGRFAAMAAGSKPNGCLVLDYGQNIVTHGPVDKIVIEKKYNPEKNIVEDAISCQPTKMCPACRCDNHVHATQCPECGYEYPIEIKHETVASDAAILSADIEPEWFDVEDVMYAIHKKAGKPDSLKVTYLCGISIKNEWVCLSHDGYARTKAVKWWKDRAGTDAPLNAHEALERQREVKKPIRISVKPDGKYERIVGYEDAELAEVVAPVQEAQEAAKEEEFEIPW